MFLRNELRVSEKTQFLDGLVHKKRMVLLSSRSKKRRKKVGSLSIDIHLREIDAHAIGTVILPANRPITVLPCGQYKLFRSERSSTIFSDTRTGTRLFLCGSRFLTQGAIYYGSTSCISTLNEVEVTVKLRCETRRMFSRRFC